MFPWSLSDLLFFGGVGVVSNLNSFHVTMRVCKLCAFLFLRILFLAQIREICPDGFKIPNIFVCVCVCEQLWCFEPSRLYQVKGIRGKEMEHLHQALVSKKIRQTEREWVQHILICPFGWLGKNIMPLPGTARGMERRSRRDLEEEGGIERSGDWKRKAWQSGKGMKPVFPFTLPSLTVWWAPIKEASRDWALLILIQINFLPDRSVLFFFLSFFP